MIKLGYFCSGNPAQSETFIYDLLKEFNISKDFHVSFISGATKPLKIDFEIESFATGFNEKFSKASYRLHKFLSIKGNNAEYGRMRFNQWKAYRQLNKAKLPKIDIAYIEYASTGILTMEYLEKNKIPFVVHVHGYDVTTSLNDKAYFEQLKILFRKADKIITPSKHLKRLLITLGCLPEKIDSIYPVTNIESINEQDWDIRLNNPPSITFLGRLTEKKNPFALIHAFNLITQKIPIARLNILGDGPLKEELELLVKNLKLNEKVFFKGSVTRETAFKYLRESWVYAQHSVTSINGDQEGFPVSLAEAAAHSLPIVSTIHSGITENVIEDETGYLVQEYDYEKMALKIIHLIQNPKIARQLGENGRMHILKICPPGKRFESIKHIIYNSIKNNETN